MPAHRLTSMRSPELGLTSTHSQVCTNLPPPLPELPPLGHSQARAPTRTLPPLPVPGLQVNGKFGIIQAAGM